MTQNWYLVTHGEEPPWTVRARGPAAAAAKAALKHYSIHSYAALKVKQLVDMQLLDSCRTPTREYYVQLGKFVEWVERQDS